MVTATVLVVIFAPLFYVLVEKIFGRKQKQQTEVANPSEVK
jgi:HAE1 family hydrophobic/amphiphilic exporter-1